MYFSAANSFVPFTATLYLTSWNLRDIGKECFFQFVESGSSLCAGGHWPVALSADRSSNGKVTPLPCSTCSSMLTTK
uniref:Uncharacterized protein n=1 Tax=Rhizophora mucronata TaxID=61149 RepID=A0A2P2Q2L6_RHIMU